ncbi:hypothetical protein HBI16_156400 [Parastagonospora nodorum]|nr:hypothetical protein HBH75_093450 [Parastagonospora nodorum]KAH5765775.1 hypothetical protein HBI16_156400 [Parastagonospora nodorum]
MASPFGLLKASVLCKACGTSPSYDPPISEWVYLGADQPAHVEGEPEVREKWSDWRQRRSPGGLRMAVPGMYVEKNTELRFARQPIKRMSSESQLTRGIKMGLRAGNEVTLADKYGLQGLTCEDLPSAFDSESDEED